MTNWRVAASEGGTGSGLPDRLSAAEQALLDRRVVLVSGRIDDAKGAAIAASLMVLAALGDEPVEMRISAESDSLDVALALMDTIDSLGVAVHGTVAGTVGGTMVGVLAACAHRRIGAFAHIHIREPQAEFTGIARELHQQALDMQARLEDLVRRIAEVTGRPFEHVEADLRSGLHLDATGAVAYGLADGIAGRP
ncbi:MAG TPA: ATP-dependent Clp protease proteolytic subunit [Acidimicrobiales bacterium]|nr:ATP-dependent Clp protease proteolytic subunit [Acidimicrobiales bacterium]